MASFSQPALHELAEALNHHAMLNHRVLDAAGAKHHPILKYPALNARRRVLAEVTMEALWPEAGSKVTKNRRKFPCT